MNKVLIIMALFLVSSFAKEITIKDFEKLSPIKAKNIKVSEFEDLGTIYILEGTMPTKRGLRTISFSVSSDLKYSFFGRTVNNKTSDRVYIKKSPIAYKKDASFTYGSGEDEYYIFTDPECPFCKRFEKRLLSLDLKKSVKIYYYLYPLPFHKKALPMSRYILSQKNNKQKLEAMEKIIVEDSPIYQTKHFTQKELTILDKKINLIKTIVNDLGVTGTPTILKPDGTKLNVNEFFKEYDGR